jgi:DNA-binding NarL/FixJ family response regulator
MKIKVAMVDDQELILQGLSMMLESAPFIEIVLKGHSEAGLCGRLREVGADVLLLDIRMPDANGIDICRELNREMPELGVIALTNFEEMHYVRQMLHSGAKGYLLKNTDQETLLKAIEEVYFGRLYLDSQIHRSVVNELTFGPNRRRSAVQLTKREKEILKLIVDEHSNQQIADKLDISLRTVETHRFNLTQKLSVKNAAGLVKEAIRLGLV